VIEPPAPSPRKHNVSQHAVVRYVIRQAKRGEYSFSNTHKNGHANGHSNGSTSRTLAERQLRSILEVIRDISDPIVGEVALDKTTLVFVRTFGILIGPAIDTIVRDEPDRVLGLGAFLSALGGVDDEPSAEWRRKVLEEYSGSRNRVLAAGAGDGLDLLDEWSAGRENDGSVVRDSNLA